MGQVVLSLEEYDQLKKQADIAAQTRDCFALYRGYSGDIKLQVTVGKAAEIFKAMFSESRYNDGSYEIEVDEERLLYETDVAEYYVKAVKKKEEPKEETEEEDEE